MNEDTNIPERVGSLEERVAAVEAFQSLPPAHRHTGLDSDPVDWTSVGNRVLTFRHTLPGAAAATGANYGAFLVVPQACRVVRFVEVHRTAGTDASAVTVDLEKLTSGTAEGSGSSVLSAALSLKSTANTPQEGTITSTNANRTLADGDRLALKDSGTLTAVADVTVMVQVLLI